MSRQFAEKWMCTCHKMGSFLGGGCTREIASWEGRTMATCASWAVGSDPCPWSHHTLAGWRKANRGGQYSP